MPASGLLLVSEQDRISTWPYPIPHFGRGYAPYLYMVLRWKEKGQMKLQMIVVLLSIVF